MAKNCLFITSSRADFGKLKPLMNILSDNKEFNIAIFVTGMHMYAKYGTTGNEIAKSGFKNIFYFINQKPNDSLDSILAQTIHGLSNFLHYQKPDIIFVHGDRVEALAGALAGALNNILVGHIEGGEVSGTIDESIRHSVSKMAHIHFVANQENKNRLLRMGEKQKNIYIIGSPDIDLMLSPKLPSLKKVLTYYEIPFSQYAIFTYHPVTTQLLDLSEEITIVVNSLIQSKKNYVVIYPNNDPGADIIIGKINTLKNTSRFRVFPSLRFEYFLTLLKKCEFIIGNSSAGIREAPIYGIPSINIGTRQNNRFNWTTITNVNEHQKKIIEAITNIHKIPHKKSMHFGDGKSANKFIKVLRNPEFWKTQIQKHFID